MKRLMILSVIAIPFMVSGQTNGEDIGYARPSGSSPYGININTPTNSSGSGLDAATATNFQIATRGWSGSHAILFNSFASQNMVNGSLSTTGNTKYANDAGNYGSGAGAIIFNGNGGTMRFFISPTSTVANNDITWGTPQLYIMRNGYVGINTSSPSETLHVGGNSRIEGSTTIVGNQIRFSEARGFDYDINKDAVLFNGYNNGQVAMLSDREGNAWFAGNVGIGTTTPSEKLEVNGTIRSKEVKVEATGWPDYVFEPSYNLRTLEETEAYIKENNHLPEVPSATEMETNGVLLGQMNMLLLKKIEELTLHAIAQEKKLSSQNAKIDNYELIIDSLSQQQKILIKRIEKIENK